MNTNEDMVKNMAQNFQNKGLEVLFANCDGFEKPSDIQGVKPDIIGWDPTKEIYHLGIAADPESAIDDSDKEKIQVLAKMMMSTGTSQGKRLPFYVGVTKDTTTVVDKKLQETDPVIQENIEKILV